MPTVLDYKRIGDFMIYHSPKRKIENHADLILSFKSRIETYADNDEVHIVLHLSFADNSVGQQHLY